MRDREAWLGIILLVAVTAVVLAELFYLAHPAPSVPCIPNPRSTIPC